MQGLLLIGYPCPLADDVRKMLEVGVADADWGTVACQAWPNDAFRTTKVVTERNKDIANLVVFIANNDHEGKALTLEMDIPNVAKVAIEDENIKDGQFAKIVKRETICVGGKE